MQNDANVGLTCVHRRRGMHSWETSSLSVSSPRVDERAAWVGLGCSPTIDRCDVIQCSVIPSDSLIMDSNDPSDSNRFRCCCC
jgi:hypothetical protein